MTLPVIAGWTRCSSRAGAHDQPDDRQHGARFTLDMDTTFAGPSAVIVGNMTTGAAAARCGSLLVLLPGEQTASNVLPPCCVA